MKFDILGIVKHITKQHAEFLDDADMSPDELEALSRKHIARQCGGKCGFCKIDRSAAMYVMTDNADATVKH